MWALVTHSTIWFHMSSWATCRHLIPHALLSSVIPQLRFRLLLLGCVFHSTFCLSFPPQNNFSLRSMCMNDKRKAVQMQFKGHNRKKDGRVDSQALPELSSVSQRLQDPFIFPLPLEDFQDSFWQKAISLHIYIFFKIFCLEVHFSILLPTHKYNFLYSYNTVLCVFSLRFQVKFVSMSVQTNFA